jgi:hypothetical protein
MVGEGFNVTFCFVPRPGSIITTHSHTEANFRNEIERFEGVNWDQWTKNPFQILTD